MTAIYWTAAGTTKSTRAAELGLIEAELACLAKRFAAAARDGVAEQSQDVLYRIRDALIARRACRRRAKAGPLDRM